MASFFSKQYDEMAKQQIEHIQAEVAAGRLTPDQGKDAIAMWQAVNTEQDKGGATSGSIQGAINDVPGSQRTLSNQGVTALGGGPGAQLAGVDPDAYKMLQMHLGALGAQEYRPEMAQGRINALGNELSAYRPMNNVLGSMYGAQGQIDTTQGMRNPLSDRAMQIGAPNQQDIGLSPMRPPPASPYSTGPGLTTGVGAPGQYAPHQMGMGNPLAEALRRLGRR
jgi:hypothetical protein